MSRIYNRYVNNVDHTWYDSSNVIYSACYDGATTKSLKIVFKGGSTYLYKDINPIDYLLFRDAESNGKVFNTHIKKYPCVKQDNTDLGQLDLLKQTFQQDETVTIDHSTLELQINNESGEFVILKNGNIIFSGIEGQISIMNLFKSLGINYMITENTNIEMPTVENFETRPLI